jgi:hypothetical protein
MKRKELSLSLVTDLTKLPRVLLTCLASLSRELLTAPINKHLTFDLPVCLTVLLQKIGPEQDL